MLAVFRFYDQNKLLRFIYNVFVHSTFGDLCMEKTVFFEFVKILIDTNLFDYQNNYVARSSVLLEYQNFAVLPIMLKSYIIIIYINF